MAEGKTKTGNGTKNGPAVNYNEPADAYELGATIDGHFVPFYTLDGPSVRGRIEAAKAAATTAAGGDDGSS